MKAKIKALSEYLGEDLEEAERLIDNESYLVLTDDEANERAKEYIEDMLWAFNADFLEDMTGIPAKCFEALQGDCEDANDIVGTIVTNSCGVEELDSAAIDVDGRGHFITSYDGEENEQDGLFIYRMN